MGGNAELIVDELLAVLTNQKRTAWGRVQAAALLLNRGWGREPLTVMVETPEEGHVDLRYATNEELDQLEEIYRRVDARALEGRDQRLLPAPLTAGQGDVGSHVGNTMVNADDIATE